MRLVYADVGPCPPTIPILSSAVERLICGIIAAGVAIAAGGSAIFAISVFWHTAPLFSRRCVMCVRLCSLTSVPEHNTCVCVRV